MRKVRDLPPAELDVMNVLWQKREANTKEIQAALGEEKKLAYTTVATLLSRLREKGYVEAEERNFAYVYRPLVKREQVVKRKLDDLVKRLLGGDVTPLAAYIAENKKLTPKQVEALEDIVQSKSEPEKED